MDRLGKLKELEDRLYVMMEDCDSKTMPALAKQYRETIREIEEIEGDSDQSDDIAKILAQRADLGKPGAVRKSLP